MKVSKILHTICEGKGKYLTVTFNCNLVDDNLRITYKLSNFYILINFRVYENTVVVK